MTRLITNMNLPINTSIIETSNAQKASCGRLSHKYGVIYEHIYT